MMKPGDLSDYLTRPYPAEWAMDRLFQRDRPLVIFDIGACEGEETIRFSRKYPRAIIHTFEPLPENQMLIKQNFDSFRIERARLCPLALSDREGKAKFYVSSGEPETRFSGEDWNYGNKSSSLLKPSGSDSMPSWIHFGKTIEVSCAKLDDYCREEGITRIDWIHMDVQGAEYQVIEGGREILKHSRAVWLETMDEKVYQDQKLRWEIEDVFHSMGFRLITSQVRGIEQDQLYLQTRIPSNWPFFLSHRIRQTSTSLRMRLGSLKKSLKRAFPL